MSTNSAREVTLEHARILRTLDLTGNPEVLVHRRIPGFGDESKSPRLSRGIHVATMGEQLGRTFSSRQDIRFGTAVVLCEGTTTTSDEAGDRQLVEWRRAIVDALHNRRVTELSCELVTQITSLSLEMSPSLAREQDVVGFEIWSYFRESRS